jgi:23S rRNA pseudouridine2605 synthase
MNQPRRRRPDGPSTNAPSAAPSTGAARARVRRTPVEVRPEEARQRRTPHHELRGQRDTPLPVIRDDRQGRHDGDAPRQRRGSDASAGVLHAAPRVNPKPITREAQRLDTPKVVGVRNEFDSDRFVPRAKRLRVRHQSEKLQALGEQLRKRRLETDDIEPVRLQKALAYSGVGSRRDADELVAAGKVEVNGKVAEPGMRVGPGDRVRVNGKPVHLRWPDRLPRVVLYHKPEGELVSREDRAGRPTVFERLPIAHSSKWVAIGRLDFNTSGLLILTTAGELANRMSHPSFEIEREYSVRVLGEVSKEQMSKLTLGIELEDGPAHFEHISEQGGEGLNRWYRVVIKEGRNREVRRMFEHFGLTVSRLIRVRFGNIGLPSRLKRGQYYELTEPEVMNVLKWAGLDFTGH